jgi:glyoxylase-like metal-dependent hydrolase (beta-lactamase superfamily II)
MSVPPGYLHRDEGRLRTLRAIGFRVPREQLVELPVLAFLVEHPRAGKLLVDTGFHPSVAVDPDQAFGRIGRLVIKSVEMDTKQSLPAQLRDRGITAGEIGLVLMTHLHADHAGAVSEFPRSTFLVTGDEWRAAGAGGARQGYSRRHFDHAFDWRTIDFGERGADSFATFGRSLDVLGDGSVRLVSTPGHSAGHMSVVLRLRKREVLLAGDAVDTLLTLRESRLPYMMSDEHRFRRSLREIQLYARENPDALVLCGHDMEQWRGLREAYE